MILPDPDDKYNMCEKYIIHQNRTIKSAACRWVASNTYEIVFHDGYRYNIIFEPITVIRIII